MYTSEVQTLIGEYERQFSELAAINIDDEPDIYRSILFEIVRIEQEIDSLYNSQDYEENTYEYR